MRKFFLLLTVLLGLYITNAQEVKTIKANFVQEKIKIDGQLSEKAWQTAPVASDFIQFEPVNGGKASQKTLVKVLHDQSGIYIAAIMYDSAPDSIRFDLTRRDEEGISDAFAVSIDPFDEGLYAFTFQVSAAGVQRDMKITPNNMDPTWDAVWESNVARFDSGWVVEIKIPYSALRFSSAKEQTWRINFFRFIARNMELDVWQFIDKTKPGFVNQYGLLTGLKDIKPPLRLAFMPYVSGYLNNNNGKWNYLSRGGMDLKYGINESFTLDMMLIPDFGQVESDDQVLNLSPFETYYVEKRQFFTEGSELFNKGRIFYSRRIGSTPIDFYEPYSELKDNEIIKSNPSQTQIINATKITGRTNKGLGLGLLNAMTAPSHAVLVDTITGEERQITTQGFTNYNVLVLDQSLKNNSYISLINTNMLVAGGRLTSNVTATDYQIRMFDGWFTLSGINALSQRYTNEQSPEYGFRTNIKLSKSKGNFLYGASTDIMDDKYDINDMGFLRRNNKIESEVWISYNQYRATKYFLSWSAFAAYSYRSLYEEGKFESSAVKGRIAFRLKNQWNISFFNYTELKDEFNWYEPRIWGRFYRDPRNTFIALRIETNRSKNISFNNRLHAFYANKQKNGYSFSSDINLRLSNRFNIKYVLDFGKNNRYGFVNYVNYDSIYFGLRHQQTLTNTFNVSYIFSPKHNINMRLRHYWSIADYEDNFYFLNYDGTLSPTDFYTNADINFNAFTIDFTYTWYFAPGSELTFVWKNQIYTSDDNIIYNFTDNLGNTLRSPQSNSLSIKILYYLDWSYFNRRVKPKIAKALRNSHGIKLINQTNS